MALLVAQARRLEPLGWTVVPTKSGYIIRNPHGGTAGLHTSGGSDTRGLNNTIADLNLIGFAADLATLDKQNTSRRRSALNTARVSAQQKLAAPADANGAAAVHASLASDDVARPAGYRGMHTRTEQISPERARELADRPFTATTSDGAPLRQRRRDTNHIAWLRGIIDRGDWLETPEGLSVCTDGSILDGQHRLEAIASSETGRTVTMRVTYNVPADVFVILNTGKNRSAPDVVGMVGHESALMLVSALKLVYHYTMWRDTSDWPTWPSWSKIKLTNQIVVECAARWPDMPDHVRVGTNTGTKTHMIGASIAAFRHLTLEAWPDGQESLDEFCEQLRTGENLRAGDPALTLRNWAARTPPRTILHRRETLLLVLLKCWAAHATGKKVGTIPHHDTTKAMPLPYSPRRRRSGD
jgi:hypothetical protein